MNVVSYASMTQVYSSCDLEKAEGKDALQLYIIPYEAASEH